MKYTRAVTSVAARLRSAKGYGAKTALLMGHGCASSAGIPAPEGCVNILDNEFPQLFGNLKKKSFGGCMAQLSLADRARMIGRFLDSARMNWTHLCVAVMLKEGFLQRVLTLTYDNLLARACALMNFFPAIYEPLHFDKLDSTLVSEPAIFHLRGQAKELLLLGSDEDTKRHQARLNPVFAHSGSRFMWVVVGHDGQVEPEYTHLAGVKQFEKDLYWVGEGKEAPPTVKQDFLRLGKDAYYVPELTPDDFFLALAKALDLFPPIFIDKPFTFLQGMLNGVTPFPATGQRADKDVQMFKTPLAWVEDAISRYELGMAPQAQAGAEGKSKFSAASTAPPEEKRPVATCPAVEGPPDNELLGKIRVLFESQQFKQIITELAPYGREHLSEETGYLLSRAFMMQGNGMLGAAKKRAGKEAGPLYEEAAESYGQAVALNPVCYQSLNNWGYCLKCLAEQQNGANAERLLKEAVGKYEAALKVKPDCYQVLNNWGHALKMRSELHHGSDSENLLKEAIGKYQAALNLKEDDFTALHNWGNALLAQADKLSGSDGDRLRGEGMKKIKAAQAVMLLRT